MDGLSGRSEHLENMGVYQQSPQPSSMGRIGPSIPPMGHQGVRISDNDEVRNDAAAALFQQPIHQPGDALRLLVDAASRTESMSIKRPPVRGAIKDLIDQPEGAIDPAITKASTKQETSQYEDPALTALQTWSRLRYVRAGWFTPREGMAYLEYFSEHMSPLTPTPIPDFSDPATHIKLLSDEPMLAVTLLMIASRYKKLPGSGGASRSIHIHAMLWKECRDMITRMFWGQEYFGSSFGLASGFRADTGENVKRGFRGLGTVEALLILSDWHPRAMHFPSAPGNDSILAPLEPELDEANRIMETRNPHQGWTEPAMRSDRMSWSLVGMAYNLAVELGVFDSMPEMGAFVPGYSTRAYDKQRADRVGRLIHIYVSQTSGRLGYPNMLPKQGSDMSNVFFRMDLNVIVAGEQLRAPGGRRLLTLVTDSNPEIAAEQMQRAWCELTAIMQRLNHDIFRSKQQTLDLIQRGDYTDVVESFWPILKEWLSRVNQIKLPTQTHTILLMEYEYIRTYINSLALQAQLEQINQLTNNDPNALNPDDRALFSAKLVEISKKNAPYIAEVVDSTRNLLRHVVEVLQPSGAMKNCPTRTSFRILSGAMFLLKSFALGSKESDITTNLNLLRDTANALRSTVIDDVHLNLRIADLLASLIGTISTKFVRVPINSRPGHAKRHRASLSSRPGYAQTSSMNQNTSTKPSGDTKDSNDAGLGDPALKLDSHQSLNGANNQNLPFAPPLVNPNDPNITIMPPPDYVYNFDGPLYPGPQTVSPRSAATLPNGYPPNTFGQTGAGASHHSPSLSQPGLKYSAGQPFSPMSSSSGGYDWYAIDVNPLLQSNSANGAGGAGMQGGYMGGLSNLFGPELGDGLEMLGTLADNLPFDDSVFGGAWMPN